MVYKNIKTLIPLSLCVALLFGGCNLFENKDEQKTNQQPPKMKVSTIEVAKTSIPLTFEYQGRIKSLQEVAITAKISGTLTKQHFTEGAFVSSGTLLYSIDPEIYQASFDSAKASLLQSEAIFNQAEKNLKRGENLKLDDAISQREYENLELAFEQASAQVSYAKAKVKEAQINLSYTNIKAPFDGIIGKNIQDIGSYINGQSASNHLNTLTKLDPIGIEFFIPKSDIQRGLNLSLLKNRDSNISVRILDEEYKDEELGVIDFIDSKIDDSTGTIQARAIFPNKHSALIPGGFARVAITGIDINDGILIPQKAIMQSAKGSSVYLYMDSNVTPLMVTLGDTIGDKQIVLSGLKGGERIILDNLNKIRPGMQVEAINTIQNQETK